LQNPAHQPSSASDLGISVALSPSYPHN
jgi:hypothetical protein